MTRAILPPKTEVLIDEEKFPTLNWLAFFDLLADGDSGSVWVPTFVGLTEVGTAIKTGKYWRLTKNLAFFRITITASTSTAATAGVTYCDNFPLNITAQGMCATINSSTAQVSGITTDKKIYTSTWAATPNTITLIGIAEVS